MNRPIKFRGRCVGNGTLLYGDLTHEFDDVYVGSWRVEPESVAQLVGFDKDGAEVYEGDIIVNPRDNTRFKAAMNHIYTVKIYVKEAKT